MRPVWLLVSSGLFLAATGWAIYASSVYFFLAHAFPAAKPASSGLPATMAAAQAYAVAFGPLGIWVGGAFISLLRRRR
jgi:hypothetical protein